MIAIPLAHADSYSFAVAGLPSWASINTATGEITGTPSESDNGVSSVTVMVDDGQGGSDSETFNLTIVDVNAAPQLDSIGDQSMDEGALLSFTATASDADLPAQTLTFSLSGEPSGAIITAAGDFAFTPTEDQGPGSYTLDVIVSDGIASDSETITVTVNEVNTAPELGAIGDKSADELSLLAFNTTATDTDLPANALTFSLSGSVPSSASITTGGAFSWTPAEAQGPGIYTFDVVVSDGSASDSETITVTVGEVANTDITRPNVAITSPLDGDTISGPSGGVTIHVEGAASDGESGIQEVMIRTETAAYQLVTPASLGDWSTWSHDVVFHTSGNHQLVARAIDNAGNMRWSVISMEISGVDTIRPTVTITSPASSDSISGPAAGVHVLVEGTAYDGQSGVQTVQIRAQDSGYQTATPGSPGNWTLWSFDKLFTTEGPQQIVARVTDSAGNMQWHIINIRISGTDTVRPSLTVTSSLEGNNITGPSSGVTVHIEGTASDLSGVQIVETRMQGTVYQPAIPASPGDWSTWSRDMTITTEGSHQLVVKATDNSGNMQWVIINVNISLTS